MAHLGLVREKGQEGERAFILRMRATKLFISTKDDTSFLPLLYIKVHPITASLEGSCSKKKCSYSLSYCNALPEPALLLLLRTCRYCSTCTHHHLLGMGAFDHVDILFDLFGRRSTSIPSVIPKQMKSIPFSTYRANQYVRIASTIPT